MFTDRDFMVKQAQHEAQLAEAERMRLVRQVVETKDGLAFLQRLGRLVRWNEDTEQAGPSCLTDEPVWR